MGEWGRGGKDAGAGLVGSPGHEDTRSPSGHQDTRPPGHEAVEGWERREEQQRYLPEERASSAARTMGGPGQERGEARAARGEN